ncbi:MAG TPA: hypothetical protein VFV76_02530 [Actinomycetes bacterium]|nr:hypothetical protein [Actinomycetes bacterium]
MRLFARLRVADPAPADRGDIILGWLTKITAVLAVAGIGLFDAISIGTTAVNLADQGSYAAREASEVWQSTQSVQKAYDTAVEVAREQNGLNEIDPTSFRIEQDNTVRLRISREAATLVLFRWDRTAKWAQLESDAEGRSVG